MFAKRGIWVCGALLLSIYGAPVAAQDIDYSEAGAKAFKDWTEYERETSVRCLGRLATTKEAFKMSAGGKNYVIRGSRMAVESPDGDNEAVIGVISTTKDDTVETLDNIEQFAQWFMAEKAQAIVMGGDIGDKKQTVVKALTPLAKTGLAVYVIMGNNDVRGTFNAAIRDLHAAGHKNVVNLNLVRYVNEDDFDIVSLPGYYDEKFTADRNTCVYGKKDVRALSLLMPQQGKNPVILVSHGPPKMYGPEGIDYAGEPGNVGDEMLSEAIKDFKIPFGIFGHIIEAGTKATDLAGKKIYPEDKFVESFYLNPGSASSAYWRLNSGQETVGAAAIMTIKGKTAAYKTKMADKARHEKTQQSSDWESDQLKELENLEKKLGK